MPTLVNHYASPTFPYAVPRLVETSDGSIWLGSPTIHKFMPGKDGKPDWIGRLPNVFTLDMAVDAKGDLWVAKGVFGVYRRIEDGWEQFTAGEHLGGTMAVDLLPLEDGTLLAAMDRGISRFDGATWTASVFGNDFSMAHRQGGMRQSRDGAIRFNFAERDPRSPRVLINLEPQDRFCTVRYLADRNPPDTEIEAHPERIDSDGNIHVSWTGRDAWISTPADQLCFSWRVDGGEWSPFLRETGRSFLAEESGHHVLEVRARDHDFNIDPTPARTTFIVALPLWQRPWFVLLVVLAVGGIVMAVWVRGYYRAKQLQLRTQHLEEMDQVKSSFYTNISHELRTPLTLISEPLEDLLETEENDERREMLGMALRNAGRVKTLASQLLDFRRLELGKMRVERVRGSIRQHVDESLKLLQRLSKTNNVAMVFDCDRELSGWYDPDKLQKIVQNLVNNAIKYTPAGGRVCARLKEVPFGAGRGLLLTVEDNGPGIEPVHLKRIFERFYRIPEKSIVDGSGIGLNLTKKLVELLGGTIQVESPIFEDPNRPGSRFVVQLPIDQDNMNGAQ